jgi:hypothetical protein
MYSSPRRTLSLKTYAAIYQLTGIPAIQYPLLRFRSHGETRRGNIEALSLPDNAALKAGLDLRPSRFA